MNKAIEPEKYNAPALSKGLDILEFLSSEPKAQKKTEIAKALNRSISEIFRMLAVLERREYVYLNEETERYSLTTKLFEVAHRYPTIRRLSAVASESMQSLAMELRQSVHLSIRQDAHVLVIALAESPDDNSISVRLGARLPIPQTASGAVLTYHLDVAERDEIVKKLPNTTDKVKAVYLANCKQVEDNHCCDSPSAVVEGVVNLSVPIVDHSGRVIAAMTIPYIKKHGAVPEMSTQAALAALRVKGKALSSMLGSAAAL